MSRVEERLRTAMTATVGNVQPSPDLFARVRGSLEDAKDRRRWRRRVASSTFLGLAGAGAAVFALLDRRQGEITMDWWVLELLTTAALVALALLLGPFIKRFGKGYAADVFRANPETGKSYIVLTDFAYYLIFLAYILFTISFEAGGDWGRTVNAGQVKDEVARIGGIVLIIGLLHSLNIVALPVMGRLLSLNRRLDDDDDGGGGSGDGPGRGRRRSRGRTDGVDLPAGTSWVLRIEAAGPGSALDDD
jgi:hypothetical protein